jgi:hypothetical protein
MAAETTGAGMVLLVRDGEGTLYAFTEETIRAHAVPAEQKEALDRLSAEYEVAGYDGSLVNLGPITVAPQINTNVGLNIAAANFAPVSQVLGQTALNGFNFS